jgi:hypothetical protein
VLDTPGGVTYPDGTVAELRPAGFVVVTLSAVETVTQFVNTPVSGVVLEAQPQDAAGNNIGSPIPLPSGTVDVNVEGVKQIIIRSVSGSLSATDINTLDVSTCEKSSTTALASTTTTVSSPNVTTTVQPLCDYVLLASNVTAGAVAEFGNARASIQPGGEVVFEFDSPVEITSISAQFRTNTLLTVFPLLDESPVGAPVNINADRNEAVLNDEGFPIVVDKIIVRGTQASQLGEGELISLIIYGCAETTTPQPTTTAAATPTPTGSTTPSPYCDIEDTVQDLRIENGKCVARAVPLTVCKGSCPSQQSLVMDFPYTVNNCACCQGDVAFKEVDFECDEGSVRQNVRVPYHASCGCRVCLEWSTLSPGSADLRR